MILHYTGASSQHSQDVSRGNLISFSSAQARCKDYQTFQHRRLFATALMQDYTFLARSVFDLTWVINTNLPKM